MKCACDCVWQYTRHLIKRVTIEAALFAASAIGYRGAILALHRTAYLLPATFALAT